MQAWTHASAYKMIRVNLMTRTRTVVRINSRLVGEAARVLGAKSRTDAVHMALREIVALRSFKKLMKKHASKLKFAGYDR
jgi:Arc/MetJ family transcription regulator